METIMSNILVTGGAGYIGSVLVPDLLAKGHKVTVIDNFMYKQTSLASCIRDKNFKLIFGDVRNESEMGKLIDEAEIIIPLAAIVGAPACEKDPILASSVNKDSLLWLFKQIKPNQRVIMPTTNSAYGSGDSNNYCDENSELNPISTYAKDKVIIEEALTELNQFTSFRLATVFGISPRMRLDLLVNNFVYRAITDKFIVIFEGHFKRNYIHILDVVAAFNLAIENKTVFTNQIFNVGLSDANISKVELCNEIKKLLIDFTFLEAPYGKDPDQRNYVVSNKKIEKLGFSPKFSLRDGIIELVKGLKMFEIKPFSNL
jgi:nucleoside-diphosphate-sugar epimerase